jgi:hypothetical protein
MRNWSPWVGKSSDCSCLGVPPHEMPAFVANVITSTSSRPFLILSHSPFRQQVGCSGEAFTESLFDGAALMRNCMRRLTTARVIQECTGPGESVAAMIETHGDVRPGCCLRVMDVLR